MEATVRTTWSMDCTAKGEEDMVDSLLSELASWLVWFERRSCDLVRSGIDGMVCCRFGRPRMLVENQPHFVRAAMCRM